MMKSKLKSCCLGLLLALLALPLTAGSIHGFDNCRYPDSRPMVLPMPQDYRLTGGVLELPEKIAVQLPAGEEVILEVLNAELAKFGRRAEASADAALIKFTLTEQGVPESPEGYKLEITAKGARVSARSNAGLFYGAQTLANLLANAGEAQLECCVITDYPAFSFRGYAIEYHGFTPGFRNLVKLLARLKINVLTFTLEARMPYKVAGFPVSKRTIPLKELQKMTAFCQKYHLKIMPCVQVLSHNKWLTRHKDWEKMSEGQANRPWNSQPCIQNEQARQITLEVLKEHLEIFKSDMLYICLDEIFTGPFMVCPRCKGKDAVKLLNDYLAFIRKGLNDAGYGSVKLLFCQDCLYTHSRWPWGDAFRKQSLNPAKDVIVWWDYRPEPKTEVMQPFFREKFPFIASGIPGTPTNVRRLAEITKAQHGLGIRFSRWYFSNDALLDNLNTNTPDSLGGVVQSAEYIWNLRDVHHADFPYDGTYEAMRLLHGAKLPPDFSKSAAEPVPFNKFVNTELSGTSGMFPKLDDRKLAEINSVLAERPEKYQLLTAPGGKYYGLCLRGTKKDKKGRQAASFYLANRTFKAISLLTMTSVPCNANDYLSVMKYGSKRYNGEAVVTLRFVYRNGKSETVPLRFRRELTDWNQTYGGYFMRWAVRGEDCNKFFFSFGTADIVNPCPEEPVKNLIFSSCCVDGIYPVILAAALRDADRGFAAAGRFTPKMIAKPYNPAKNGLSYLERINFLDGMGDVVVQTQAKLKGKIKTEVVEDANYGKVLKITVPPAVSSENPYVRVNVSVPFKFKEGMKSASRICRVCPKANLHHAREYFRTVPAGQLDGSKRYRCTAFRAGEEKFVQTSNSFTEKCEGDIYLKDMGIAQSRRLSFFLLDTQTPTEIYVAEFGIHSEEIGLVPLWSRNSEREFHP